MSELAKIQESFQRALLTGDTRAILDEIRPSAKESAEVLLGVYQHAYVARLVGLLKADYPVLLRVLGADFFEPLACSYIARHPSRFANARWFGSAFPEHVAAREGAADDPLPVDVARLERALADVLDAADEPRLALADLASIDPDGWPHLVFTPHPAVRRLDLNTNARVIWLADARDEPLPEPTRLAEPERLLVYRPELTPRMRVLGYEEAMVWTEMAKGVRFGILCEMLATYGGEDDAALRAAGHLKLWIEEGLLAAPLP